MSVCCQCVLRRGRRAVVRPARKKPERRHGGISRIPVSADGRVGERASGRGAASSSGPRRLCALGSLVQLRIDLVLQVGEDGVRIVGRGGSRDRRT